MEEYKELREGKEERILPGGGNLGGGSLNCKVRPLGDCTLRKNISLGVTGEWTRVDGKK